MRAPLRAIAGLAGAALLTATLCAPASAGTGRAQTEGWWLEVSVADYTWTTPTGCEQVPVHISMQGWGADTWALDLGVRSTAAGSASMPYYDGGDTTAPETVDGAWHSYLLLCDGATPGGFLLSGNALYGRATDYGDGGQPGAFQAPLSASFTLSRMASTTSLGPVVSNGRVAQVSGRVLASSSTLGKVGVEGQKVSIQRYLAGAWREAGAATTTASGSFTAAIGGVTAAVPYRAVFAGSRKVGPSTSAHVVAKVPPPPLPKPAVLAWAKSKRSKLKVDVNPNQGKGYWSFEIQRKTATGWAAGRTVYRTKGTKETRTVNLPKGTYRVKVHPKYGRTIGYSAAVTLVK